MLQRLPPAATATVAAATPGLEDATTAEDPKPLVIVPDGMGSSSTSNRQRGSALAEVGAMSDKFLQHAASLGLAVVCQRWLVDSVSSMELLPVDGHAYKP